MEQLILRQAAIDALRTCYDTETITMDNGDEYINYGDAVGEIEQLPPIQPAEPKRGKWNRLGRDVFNCNKCGATFDLNQGGEKMHFCPNCMADMREVTNGN